MPLDRLADLSLVTADLWTSALRAGETGLLAETAEGALPVKPAPSCLVLPLPGDMALLHGQGAQAVILAILARAPGQGTTLAPTDGETLSLRARSIALEASERLTARAPLGEFDLARATLRSATALLLAGTATLAASLLRGAAQRIEQSAEHIVTLAGRRTTRVRGEDMLDAGSSLSTVETLSLSRSGGSTIMTARQDLRVDAERIGLG